MALALALAQDKRFRKRLFSAIEHGAEAGRRTHRALGLSGAVTRLATDDTLLDELKGARRDLQQAYGRLEAKRRTHRLRNFLILAALALLVAVPQLRARLAVAVEKARQRLPDVGSPSGRSSFGNSRPPRRLEDMTKEELYEHAQADDIPGRSEMSKEQLVEALRAKS
jgi:hypothetical protein